MSKHTPGPWVADKLQDRDTFNIFASGFVTAMCQVTCMDNSTRRVTGNEVAANARLIAAAPNLLDVLLRAKSAIEALDGTTSENEKLLDDYRKVVAMATGEPT